MDESKALARARNRALTNYIDNLKGRGYDEVEIAIDLGINEEQLRSFYKSAREELHIEKLEVAKKLRKQGSSNSSIATYLGISLAQVNALIGREDKKASK